MKSLLIRVRYYQGNVFLATAINHPMILSAQSEAGFEPAANAIAFRAFPRKESSIRAASRAEILTDPAQAPSDRD